MREKPTKTKAKRGPFSKEIASPSNKSTSIGIASAPVVSTSRAFDSQVALPEFYPVPPKGLDPHFSTSRSGYYDLESRGLLKLVRIRKPGNIRGRVLVPYVAMRELMRRFADGEIA